ncbi:MAG TPA: hypothetical protein DHV42_00545 [Lachnospiraceae bacterium]|nr:hypothetical protein [Lachnospiraceae bacterium]
MNLSFSGTVHIYQEQLQRSASGFAAVPENIRHKKRRKGMAVPDDTKESIYIIQEGTDQWQ